MFASGPLAEKLTDCRITPPARVAALLALAFRVARTPPGASTITRCAEAWPRLRKAPGPTLTARSVEDGWPLRKETEPSAWAPPASALRPVRSMPSLANRKAASALAGP